MIIIVYGSGGFGIFLLFAKLSEVYEAPFGKDHKSKKYLYATVASRFEDVNVKTAKEVGSTPRTIARALGKNIIHSFCRF